MAAPSTHESGSGDLRLTRFSHGAGCACKLSPHDLRTVLERRRAKPQQFQLRDGSFAGDGLQHGVDLGDWENIRALVYEDSQS